MKSLNKIWNTIKDFHLIKYEIINGTIESHKFELLMKFDGIIQKGNTMTINDLAKIVNNLSNTVNGLAVEMREGFIQVNKRLDGHDARFDKIEQRLDEHDARFDKIEQRLDKYDARFDKIEQRLDEYDARFDKYDAIFEKYDTIFKRNNLK